jgi:hypothetical protein
MHVRVQPPFRLSEIGGQWMSWGAVLDREAVVTTVELRAMPILHQPRASRAGE